ncbi:MAG: cobalamin-dependent protein [Deltaproteobacteria bacterium]|nr:cobalamin-dependent protein [Deltaproteobacteria bacterium]MBW2142826.1 cobalamin-dependent protein [Deltaproteobacteria bacterium]
MNVEEITKEFVAINNDKTVALVNQALEEGLDPVQILQEGIIAGLQGVGKKFGEGEYFLAELMMAGKLGEACIEIITPHLPETAGAKKGVVVIGAVQGDLHDIGYGLVASQLKIAGFEVHQLGVNIPSMTFIDKAQELNADIIGMSAFLVTTIPNCAEVVNYLRDMGLRDKYKVIIGGAETTKEKAESMGCDGQAENAVEAVSLCEQLMGV